MSLSARGFQPINFSVIHFQGSFAPVCTARVDWSLFYPPDNPDVYRDTAWLLDRIMMDEGQSAYNFLSA